MGSLEYCVCGQDCESHNRNFFMAYGGRLILMWEPIKKGLVSVGVVTIITNLRPGVGKNRDLCW